MPARPRSPSARTPSGSPTATPTTVTRIDPTGLLTPIAVGSRSERDRGRRGRRVGRGHARRRGRPHRPEHPSRDDDRSTVGRDSRPASRSARARSGSRTARDGTVTRIDCGERQASKTIDGRRQPARHRRVRERTRLGDRPAEYFRGSPGSVCGRHAPRRAEASSTPWIRRSPTRLLAWQLLYATCAKLLELSGQARPREARGSCPRSPESLPGTLGRRQDVHLHHPQRLPLLAAVERARDRTDLQVHDRAQPQPEDEALAPPTATSRRSSAQRPTCSGEARHISGIVARGDRLTVRLDRPTPDLRRSSALPFFCAVPVGTPVDPEGVRGHPLGGAVLPRFLHARPRRRAAAQPELPRQPAACVRADRALGRHPESGGDSEGRSGRGRLRDRRGRCGSQISSSRLATAPAAPLPKRGAAVLRESHARRHLPRAEPRASALPGRASPEGGQLRDRPSRAGPPRHASSRNPDRPTDQYLPPGLPGFTDALGLSIHPFPGAGETTGRSDASHGRALCVFGRPLRPDRTDRQSRPGENRNRRSGQGVSPRRGVPAPAHEGRALGPGLVRVACRLPGSGSVRQRPVPGGQSWERLASPGTRASSMPRHASRGRLGISRTASSTPISPAMRLRWFRTPTCGITTSSRLASAARCSSRRTPSMDLAALCIRP